MECNGMNDEEMNCDLGSYSTLCENIRQIISQVVELKTNSAIKNEDKKSEITELRMQGSFHFLSLKQLNRSAQIRCKQVKDHTLEAKQKLDGYNLQLENLQYEISHLHKEITKCLEFRSRHDDVSLVSIDEFYKNAPKEISNAEVTVTDQHKQTLARLDWELEQRKKLSEDLKQLKKLKKGVAGDISAKKQHLQALTPGLQNLLKSSLPLQEALDLPLDKLKKQHEMAHLLPRPLFVLFLQAKAYQEACDALMEVSIDGDAKLAEKLQVEANLDRSSVVDVAGGDESDSDPDDIDLDSTHGRRSRKSKEQKMDGIQSSRSVLSFHPLHINIILTTAINGPRLSLTFSYLTTLRFVVVKCKLEHDKDSDSKLSGSILSNDNFLCCLQPLDYGVALPNPGAEYSLQQSNSQVSDIFNSLGRPYVWAQKLCGLEFILPCETADMQMSFTHMPGSIQAIRDRLRSRMQVAVQVERFGRHIVTSHDPDCFPKKIHSVLTSWRCISMEEYKRLEFTSTVIDIGLLGSYTDSHLYFLATLTHPSGVALQVAIVVFSDYPRTLPLVVLRLDSKRANQNKTAVSDVNIREMEVEVNIRLEAMEELKDKDQAISFQLKRLMTLLDVYIETESRQSDTPVDTGSNQIFGQQTKGPARLKPFVFDSKKRFHHRRAME